MMYWYCTVLWFFDFIYDISRNDMTWSVLFSVKFTFWTIVRGGDFLVQFLLPCQWPIIKCRDKTKRQKKTLTRANPHGWIYYFTWFVLCFIWLSVTSFFAYRFQVAHFRMHSSSTDYTLKLQVTDRACLGFFSRPAHPGFLESDTLPVFLALMIYVDTDHLSGISQFLSLVQTFEIPSDLLPLVRPIVIYVASLGLPPHRVLGDIMTQMVSVTGPYCFTNFSDAFPNICSHHSFLHDCNSLIKMIDTIAPPMNLTHCQELHSILDLFLDMQSSYWYFAISKRCHLKSVMFRLDCKASI